jgi:hypothetical protein
MGTLDLDGYAAARREAEGDEPKFLTFKGEKFELPAEVPWDAAIAFGLGKNQDGITELLGEEAAARFFELRPSVDDIEAFLTHTDDVYPAASGEASGRSGTRSKRTGTPSKRTSSGSTD